MGISLKVIRRDGAISASATRQGSIEAPGGERPVSLSLAIALPPGIASQLGTLFDEIEVAVAEQMERAYAQSAARTSVAAWNEDAGLHVSGSLRMSGEEHHG